MDRASDVGTLSQDVSMVDGESADSTSARASTTTAGAATTSAPASLGPPPSTSSSDAAPPPSAAAQADALLRQIGFFSGLLHRPTKAAARAGAGADRLPDELRLQVLEAVSATLGRALASGQFKPAEGQTGGSDDSSLQTEGDDLEAAAAFFRSLAPSQAGRAAARTTPTGNATALAPSPTSTAARPPPSRPAANPGLLSRVFSFFMPVPPLPTDGSSTASSPEEVAPDTSAAAAAPLTVTAPVVRAGSDAPPPPLPPASLSGSTTTWTLSVPTSTAAVKQEPLPSNIDPIPPPSQPPASRLAPSTVNDRPPGWRQASASGGEADGRSGPPSSHAPSPSPSHWSPTKTYARPKWINDALSHREADRSRVPSAGSKRPAASDRYEWWDDGSAGYGSSADRRGSADAPGGGAGWSAPRERERDDPRKRPRTDGRPVVDAWVGHVPPPRASGGAGPSTGPPALSSTGQIRKGHCYRCGFKDHDLRECRDPRTKAGLSCLEAEPSQSGKFVAMRHQGQCVCIGFTGHSRCSTLACRLVHLCTICRSPDHGAAACPVPGRR